MRDEDLNTIKTLVPFSQMNEAELSNAIAAAELTTFPKGKIVFKRSTEDSKVYWLISGNVDLVDEEFNAKKREAGEEVTRHPIDNHSPHRLTAVSTTNTTFLVVERSVLTLPGDNNPPEAAIDWMSTLLSSPLFEFIPPANIQTLFGKFEQVSKRQGDIVIKEGEAGDYFYVIQSGSAKVERKNGDKTAILAMFKAGDNFGQDALVSDVPRNATITMLTNGTLMRLSAPDFQSLLMEPVIEVVTIEETHEMITQGSPKTYIIDVRDPQEVELDKIPGSLNLPLPLLRKNTSKLKTDCIYVMADGGGKRAELGAYQLNEQGFTAYVLQRSPINKDL